MQMLQQHVAEGDPEKVENIADTISAFPEEQNKIAQAAYADLSPDERQEINQMVLRRVRGLALLAADQIASAWPTLTPDQPPERFALPEVVAIFASTLLALEAIPRSEE